MLPSMLDIGGAAEKNIDPTTGNSSLSSHFK